ncbi:redoxin domain-containing protein [Halobacteriaceae archaeon SHR40]|uniref:peroxiredoxin family protein n=1 Tax=Halovenus amylolytica TaxID=2500550 RepID=UPI000FE415F0
MQSITDFELENVGAGPERLSLGKLADENDFVLLLFQRDHYCTNCRSQVQDVARRYDEFQERNTAVVSIVPEPAEKLREWQEQYDLPFPLCADPETQVSDQYDQPVKYGLLGKISDFFGRMPKVVLLDCRGDEPDVFFTHEGNSTFDRPEIDELLAEIDDLQ